MVSSWPEALLLAAGALWCWPRGRRLPADRPHSGEGSAGVRRTALPWIGIWAAVPLSIVATPVSQWAVLGAVMMVLGTCYRLFRRARTARLARTDAALLARAVSMIVREVEAGASPSVAGRVAAAELPREMAALVLGAVDDGLGEPAVAASSPAGRGAAEGLSTAAVPIIADRGRPAVYLAVQRLGAVVSMANRQGIALAGVLTAAAQDLRDRADAAERRVSSTAGAVVSGYVLAALPLGGLALGAAMGADPWAMLTGSVLGSLLLVAGAALLSAGLLWADQLVRGRHG